MVARVSRVRCDPEPWSPIGVRVKKVSVSERKKLYARIRKLEQEVAQQDYERGKNLKRAEELQTFYNNEKLNTKHYIAEKDRYYTETQVQKAKIHRLEKAVTALKEAHQKTLLAFDVLN